MLIHSVSNTAELDPLNLQTLHSQAVFVLQTCAIQRNATIWHWVARFVVFLQKWNTLQVAVAILNFSTSLLKTVFTLR